MRRVVSRHAGFGEEIVCALESFSGSPSSKAKTRRTITSLFIVATLVIASLVAVFSLIAMTARATTLYVGGGGPGNYTRIQDAIDGATSGDAVFIYNGTYHEQVRVDKTLSIVGESRDAVVVDGDRVGSVINITADWVNITSLTATNGSSAGNSAGIELSGVHNCTISNVNASWNQQSGIYLHLSSNNMVTSSTATYNNGIYNGDIYILQSDYNRIEGNNVSKGGYGIHLDDSSHNTVVNNTAWGQWDFGIRLRYSSNNAVVNNTVVGTLNRGVSLLESDWNKILDNDLLADYEGIALVASSSNAIESNQIVSPTFYGLELEYYSDRNSITNNTIVDCDVDVVYMMRSSLNTFTNNSFDTYYGADVAMYSSMGNTFLNNSLTRGFDLWGSQASWDSHMIDTSNLIRGRPVYYWKNVTGGIITSGPGQVILANCSGVTVENQNLSDVYAGVEIGFSNDTTVDNITATGDFNGIVIAYSSNTTVLGNTVSNSTRSGIYIEWSNETNIIDNELRGNSWAGVYLGSSSRNVLTGNDASLGWYGFYLVYSDYNTFTSNTALGNSNIGIMMSNSDNNSVSYANLSYNQVAGFYLYRCSNDIYVNNTILSNGGIGAAIESANNNRVYHNDFINNTARGINGTNFWDDGYPSGGNYWSDYAGLDDFSGPNQNIPGGDGIGDTPYDILSGSDRDLYPLMNPFTTPPSAPRNLQTSAGNMQIDLAWLAPLSDGGSPITNYTIYRGTTLGNIAFLLEIGNVLAHTDTGLTNGQNYCYEVGAKNTVGEGPRSNAACATPATLPGRPRQLKATGGDANVTLTWLPPGNDGGSPVTNYTIYRGVTSGGETFLVELGDVLTYLDTGLTNGVTYYYTVTATNAMGESPDSTEDSATPMTLPSKPLSLVAASGDTQVILTWIPPASDGGSPITNYEIYRGTTSGGESFLVEIGNVLTRTDTGLTNGQRYFYKIAAKTAAGEGPLSDEASATPGIPPSAPIGLAASGGNRQVTLTWSPPVDNGGIAITNYVIWRGLTSGTEVYLRTIGNVTTHVDTMLTNGVTYFYKVAAVNEAGEGALSAEASATPMSVPSAPTGVVAMSTLSSVIVEWQPPLDMGGFPVANYSVYRGDSPGGESRLATIGNLLQYTDTSVVNGQTYYYVVTAINAVGEGPRSLEVVAALPDHPSAPLNLLAASGIQEVTLTWDPPASDGGCTITNYSIYAGLWSGGETFLATIGVLTTYTDTGLTNGVAYYYRVTATNAVGEGTKSNEAMAVPGTYPSPPTIASAVGIDGEIVLTILPPSDTGGLPIITYKMYRGTSPGGEVYLLDIGTPSKHYDAGLTNGIMYCYTLTAVNAIGESVPSGEECATPLATPSQPLGPTATAGDGQVQLSWLPPDDDGGTAITTYKVYRGLVSDGETLLVTLGNVLAYTDSAVTNGLTYFYMVSASNSAGEGAKSVEVSATPHPPPTVPGAPENLQAVAGFGIVTLSWQQPADDGGEAITSYTIYRGTTPSTLSQIGTVAGSVTEFGDVGVTAGTTYYYQASATNLIGEGPRSNTASATMPGPPGQPTGLAVTAGTLQATLTWSAPASDGGSPITNYRIYRGTSSGAYSPVAMTGNVLTYTDTGLAGGQTYYYSVSAVNSIGEGLKSTEQSVSIAQPPNVPPACSISAPAQGTTVSGTVTVQGAASDQDGNVVLVEVRIDGGEWRGVYGTGPWSYRWNTKSLSNGEHTIDARAYDGNDFSQIVSVTVSVDNPAEAGPVSVQSNAAGIAAIVALVILAVLLGFLVFRRKPGQKKEKVRKMRPPPEEEQTETRTEMAEEAIAPDKGMAERGISDDGFLDDDDELT